MFPLPGPAFLCYHRPLAEARAHAWHHCRQRLAWPGTAGRGCQMASRNMHRACGLGFFLPCPSCARGSVNKALFALAQNLRLYAAPRDNHPAASGQELFFVWRTFAETRSANVTPAALPPAHPLVAVDPRHCSTLEKRTYGQGHGHSVQTSLRPTYHQMDCQSWKNWRPHLHGIVAAAPALENQAGQGLGCNSQAGSAGHKQVTDILSPSDSGTFSGARIYSRRDSNPQSPP